MNKHKRSKLLPMTKIWRRKAKRVSSSSKKVQERISCETTNKQITSLSINSPHQVETASEHREETMKIEEVPDTPRQSTLCVSPKPHLKALVFLYAFEESVEYHLLSFFCDDSNLHISLFKYVLSTMSVSKESISKFLGNRFHMLALSGLRMRNFT